MGIIENSVGTVSSIRYHKHLLFLYLKLPIIDAYVTQHFAGGSPYFG